MQKFFGKLKNTFEENSGFKVFLIPNLIGLLLLSGTVVKLVNEKRK